MASSKQLRLQISLGIYALDVRRQVTCGDLRCLRCKIKLRSSQSTSQAKLIWYTFNAVRRIDVLDQCELVASSRALTRYNSGVGEEIFPYLHGQSDVGNDMRREVLP